MLRPFNYNFVLTKFFSFSFCPKYLVFCTKLFSFFLYIEDYNFFVLYPTKARKVRYTYFFPVKEAFTWQDYWFNFTSLLLFSLKNHCIFLCLWDRGTLRFLFWKLGFFVFPRISDCRIRSAREANAKFALRPDRHGKAINS